MLQKYDKAIRDRIPEIIAADGSQCSIEKVSDEIFLKYLELKLVEESNEFIASGSLEEIADLLEVIYRIIELKGASLEEIEELRKIKKYERGGFDENLILKSVTR
ncbi:phosphoribosyl-ATP pyrophosphohydrolase [Methanoculleus taiwanensis]|uniref:Phosphoribosyl-ATP pyrophosphohydrolase n=1 Tax=Methanoculleus taiwanensis TaxID=1550565 RepID=A0A498H118_9EURY|nr:nucleoside triphosphate pyrophosphohydrolase [Methanoculleus taiwanensis]RXE56025.1 phosphoribosyl-ATP pyrophosphohydrolase [Methanoculleus taiwanensis]